jgi:aspartate 1-decarboxylase
MANAFPPTRSPANAAARLAQLGDLLIICTYGPMDDAEIDSYTPKVAFVDAKNRITGMKS